MNRRKMADGKPVKKHSPNSCNLLSLKQKDAFREGGRMTEEVTKSREGRAVTELLVFLRRRESSSFLPSIWGQVVAAAG